MTYRLIKALIDAGRTTGLKARIAVLFAYGELTEEEYKELMGMLPA